MSSSPLRRAAASLAIPPLPDNLIVLGCGAVSVDYLATVAAFPNPDDKIRSINLKVWVAEEGNSPFTYIIVDNQTYEIYPMLYWKLYVSYMWQIILDLFRKTRTCIHTPGNPAMVPEELTQSKLSSALDGASLVYFDGRLWETALVVAQEVIISVLASWLQYFRFCLCFVTHTIMIQAEESIVSTICKTDPWYHQGKCDCQVWTNAPSVSSALVSILVRLPNVKFVIVTLGEKEASEMEETEVDSLLDSLRTKVGGRTAEIISPTELIDTTGAGDAFIGAVLYAICAGMPPEKMLPFASQVAAANCRALGARSGLLWRADPRLAPFWH
ncbi:hypothetical protein BHM03_00000750 [Ensete ventricosum]|nr:hypothetical protein BHM03_00000750 [Ensete ventricosum]